jgi:hypothetical protein
MTYISSDAFNWFEFLMLHDKSKGEEITIPAPVANVATRNRSAITSQSKRGQINGSID